MRSDARKRMERLARVHSLRPVRVCRGEFGDWEASCDASCTSPLDMAATDWHDAYEAALGHACLHHGALS